ncbi:MAG TPA: CHASE domain-containing protein, partial [Phycisphaerae bacterium]|nr:CHASE domain-containing protein [Phycisphaerae bacterium]
MSVPRFFRPLTRGMSPQRSRAPILVALLGTLLSIVFFLLIRPAESKLLQQDLVVISRSRAELLKASILRSSEVLYALRSFHEARGSLPQAEFDSLANAATFRQPELTALEWIPRVPHERREAVESQMRAAGHRNFQFTALTSDHAITRAPDAKEYFPVLYVEPLAPNLPAAGLDLFSHPLRRIALENARDTGQMCATSPLQLAQDTASRPGFLMLLPVYSPAFSAIPNPTVEDRRNNLAGFALAVFHIEALAASSLAPADAAADEGLDIRLEDSSGRILYQHLSQAPAPSTIARPFYTSAAGISDSVPIDIAGQSWRITFDATPAFAARRMSWIAWTVVITCSALTAALTMYLLAAMRRTALIERHVTRRTSQLSTEIIERRRAAEAARAAEEKYRSIVENAVEGIFQTTPDGHYLSANSALAKIYGYDSPDALIASLSDIAGQLYVDPGRREAFVAMMQAGDIVTEFESRVRRRDGSSIWISENARAVRDHTGKLCY